LNILGRYETGLFEFIEERYPQIFKELKEEQEISEALDKLMTDAFTAYDEEFKETVK
jgi:F-type H+-transporting ATPase subunit alpha